MLKEIVFILIYSTISLQQLHYNCMERELQFDTHLYLSSPNFPQTLKVEERQKCFFEFQNLNPIMLIFTNANLCNVMVKTAENTTLVSNLDTNADYFEFRGTFLSVHLLTGYNLTDPKCDWQAFQAFTYDLTVGRFYVNSPEIYGNDQIFAVSTIPNNSNLWFIDDGVRAVITYKMVLGYFLGPYDRIHIKIDDFEAAVNYSINRPELTHFLNVGQPSWVLLDINPNFGEQSWFYFYINLATKKLAWNSDCEFKQIDENNWIFSMYDKDNGYKHETHCTAVLNEIKNYGYKLWFEQFHIEPYFDNITLIADSRAHSFTLLDTAYIASETNFMLKFDSDNSINQAGFILHIQKYACECGESLVVLPCDGTVEQRFFTNINDPVLYCYLSCDFTIELEENCPHKFFTIHFYLPTDPLFLLEVLYMGDTLYKQHLIASLHHSLINYTITQQYHGANVNDVNGIGYHVDFKAVTDLKYMTIDLNPTNTTYFEKLTNLEKVLITVQMDPISQRKNYTIEFFVVVSNSDILRDLIIYQNSSEVDFITYYYFQNVPESPLMPEFFSRQEEFSLYFENFYPGDDGIAYFRIRELDGQNCLFEHNVIESARFVLFSQTITMTNNGTEFCKIIFLNFFKKYPLGFQKFWTTSRNNVLLLNQNGTIILTFNNANASDISPFELNENLYEMFLPSNSSLSIQGFCGEHCK